MEGLKFSAQGANKLIATAEVWTNSRKQTTAMSGNGLVLRAVMTYTVKGGMHCDIRTSSLVI